ncbi:MULTISPECIES: conjugal transfer protein [Mycobacterium]|uniref:Conjugal transfer protein n=3 Tax=Mycobacterium TaxID=1763 RepID=A0AAW5SBB3_MYCBC|nr:MULTISPECIES: conjugal transfer protein [Mycobacterium]MBZ4632010.1 conjugal transfer protein [Mycobacterium avium subsp. hominissuis]MCV6992813.1 conjugal transfer protein [Mycobacterium bouchedurhonense]MCV6993296.1 conjugal transfer protein [Mycobacterium timonense]MDV3306491.1 conjugal transfer protein [Mycobacterium avium subsp. hominissuis]ORA44481.1 hypothetical protein BST19_21280 [Mycobacterium bouchedurhonense]
MAIRKPRIQLTEPAIKWGFIATIAAAWLALLMTVVIGVGQVALLHRVQQRIDVQREINHFTKSQFFAQNFFLVWAAGDAKDAEKLASMTALPGQPELNPNPFTVLYINPSDVKVTPAGDQTEWEWVFGATIVLPEAGASTRSYYKVTVVESGGSFKALQWPRPVNDTARNFEVKPYYTIGVDLKGPLGTTVANFMTAYYTANNAGVLGRFVTTNFTDTPIAASPYTSVEVKSIQLGKDSIDPSQAKPGDSVSALVTAKASASTTTFNTIDATLRLTLSNNKQWLVDGFVSPVHFGAVSYK